MQWVQKWKCAVDMVRWGVQAEWGDSVGKGDTEDTGNTGGPHQTPIRPPPDPRSVNHVCKHLCEQIDVVRVSE